MKYIIFIGLFIFFGFKGYSQNITDNREKPNIIFILIDDMGYGDLSSYGNCKIDTPNIDRLAKEGTEFSNFYVGSPICSPSRVAFMTGQYPSRHGITSFIASSEHNEKRGMVNYLSTDAPSLPRKMKNAGYATAHFGKWHMGGGRDVKDAPKPQAYGFDESLVSFEGLGDRLLIKGEGLSDQSAELGEGEITWVEKHEITPILINRTLSFIKKQKGSPFYIHLWPGDVHDPFKAKDEHRVLFEEYANNHYEQEFLAVLYQLDQEIGRLLFELDRMGVSDNTLIVFTSDNGPTDWKFYYDQNFQPPGSSGPFRGRKWSLYEGGIRVPFLARWPGKIPPGMTNPTILYATDLFPTFSGIAGIEVSTGDFDGEDMSEVITGDTSRRTKPFFWEYGGEYDIRPGNPRYVSPRLAMREGHWKFLVNNDGSNKELYNLQKDKAETTNLVEEYPEIAERMSRELMSWKKQLP